MCKERNWTPSDLMDVLESIPEGMDFKTFTKKVVGRFKWAWLSKLLPLGLGAVAGGIANRKLARRVMDNVHTQLRAL